MKLSNKDNPNVYERLKRKVVPDEISLYLEWKNFSNEILSLISTSLETF